MPIKINDLYRTTEVQRWHIVKVKRKQSVAEHSYIVALLAEHIVYVLGLRDNAEIRVGALMYALYHDVDECVFGDVPGPVKKITRYNEMMGEHINAVMGGYNTLVKAEPDVALIIRTIVKLADLTESVKFLTLNKDSPHADTVYQKLWKGLCAFFDDKARDVFAGAIRQFCSGAELNISRRNDDVWHYVILQFLNGQDYTIDDYMRELDITTTTELGHGTISGTDSAY